MSSSSASRQIRVLPKRGKHPTGKYYAKIDTTSRAGTEWQRQLSPFYLTDIPLYGTLPAATNVENAWQFAKVYAEHADDNGEPTEAYWEWARNGWADPKPHRFPMGKGARPLYSLWEGRKLGYIEARKIIYAPLYAAAVQKTEAYAKVEKLYEEYRGEEEGFFALVDFDGYDHVKQGKSLEEVLEDPNRKMGHAFVLAGLIQGNLYWE
ncbi:hypothetical protein HK104_003938 [Borealophlyctis nickersoniae]|nr:hypothetical protein HK104_003938 [Borealophlyctis nickersoniae]